MFVWLGFLCLLFFIMKFFILFWENSSKEMIIRCDFLILYLFMRLYNYVMCGKCRESVENVREFLKSFRK